MKITLRQLEARCRELNQSLRATPWGVSIVRVHADVAVEVVPRKAGLQQQFRPFVGSTREAMAFLDGFFCGASMRVAFADGAETQDGSD